MRKIQVYLSASLAASIFTASVFLEDAYLDIDRHAHKKQHFRQCCTCPTPVQGLDQEAAVPIITALSPAQWRCAARLVPAPRTCGWAGGGGSTHRHSVKTAQYNCWLCSLFSPHHRCQSLQTQARTPLWCPAAAAAAAAADGDGGGGGGGADCLLLSTSAARAAPTHAG